MTIEEVAKRFDTRIGFELVSYGPVGLPLYRMTAVGLCIAKRAISPIDEFAMRFVSAGLNNLPDIAAAMGLDVSVVEPSLSELLRSECIRMDQSDPYGTIVLTPKGVKVCHEHAIEAPAEQTLVFLVDGLTRKPQLYPMEMLSSPRDLRDAGIPELRAFPSKAPELEELDITDVIKVVRVENSERDGQRQLLRLTSIERRERKFIDAVALAYRSESGGEIQVSFAIDGRLSEDHEQAFARSKGLDRSSIFQGLRQAPSVAGIRALLGEELYRQIEVLRPGVLNPKVRRRMARSKRMGMKGASRVEGGPGVRSDDAVEDRGDKRMDIRVLPVYDHVPLLKQALESSEKRLMIVTSAIRNAVVNLEFISTLQRALDRRVAVFIAYGSERGKSSSGSDSRAIELLQKQAAASNNLTLKVLTGSHAKVLVMDDLLAVLTSFDWLSFKGDSNKLFREEWGVLVGVKQLVDECAERVTGKFG